MRRYGLIMSVLLAVLAGCDSDGARHQGLSTLSGPDVERRHDTVLIAQGQGLYRQHCARCHGQAAEGDPHWRQPLPDGSYPPPPLDGSGHAWHHPSTMLHEVIKNGSPAGPPGQPRGRMPAWRQQLTDQQIDAVIAWFQSLWPDPVYAIWYDREQRAIGAQ